MDLATTAEPVPEIQILTKAPVNFLGLGTIQNATGISSHKSRGLILHPNRAIHLSEN